MQAKAPLPCHGLNTILPILSYTSAPACRYYLQAFALLIDSILPSVVLLCNSRNEPKERIEADMKVIITQAEAMQKNIWDDIMLMFGRTEEDEVWETEQFILTEEQARQLGLLK